MAMSESKKGDEGEEFSEGTDINKRSKKKKSGEQQDGKNQERESKDTDSSEEDDDDDREASFFGTSRRKSKKSSDAKYERDKRHWLLGESDSDSEEQKRKPKGLTEDEAKEAVHAIADGLSRELRNEFDQSTESSIEELEAVAVAAFIDSLREKVEAGDADVTEEMLDEALRETLEDLLAVDDDEAAAANHNQGTVGSANGNNSNGSNNTNGHGGGNNNGSQSNNTAHPSTPTSSAATAAISTAIAANADVNSALAGNDNSRGKGLLIGGVVGYIVGRRHGRKRAESKFQPEIDQLEEQIAELYDALIEREFMVRQVVREVAVRQLDGEQAANLATLQIDPSIGSKKANHDVSKKIDPPSLVVPVAFAALLVSNRLMTDVSEERNTWGKDLLVGGAAGYMVGRRHGRKRTETRLKSDIEQLEDQLNSLQGNLVNQDSVIDAMIRVRAEADKAVVDQAETLSAHSNSQVPVANSAESKKAASQTKPNSLEKQLVDTSIDRIAVARKNRELKRHRNHLVESGKASAVGKFNMMSSVFVERRLMDGTENSSKRKPIETMDEEELLAMSQNIYVDEESAIDLYDKGRVELEVLRESVIQYWRKTGDYEHTLRSNLKRDESVINDIRADLERAYRSILDNAQST